MRFLCYALYVIAGCGIGYLAVAFFSVSRFARHKIAAPRVLPGITILKPVYGLDVELFENLCSFCEQEYPEFQVLFGVQRHDDPAIDVIRRVIERYPELDLSLVVRESPLTGNPKIANVANMMPLAKHPILTIVDSDMRVDKRYLLALAAEFDDASVGAATCLYEAAPRDGFASQLAAAGINDQFAPSVLVAALGSLRFCFGSTMAVRRDVLEKIGGIAALAPHLADDYMLGALVSTHGYRVSLSRYVVRNIICEPTIGALWDHEVRWGRTIRLQRPLGYAASVVTYPLPFALLSFFCGNAVVSLVLTATVLALRTALQYRMRAVFSPQVFRPWLIPVRDVFGLAVWAGSYFGRNVRWREEALSIDSIGRVEGEVR